MALNFNYFNSANASPDEALLLDDEIEDCFTYHPWTPEQITRGEVVREALAGAFRAILVNVPPGPDRTVALRKIREARMDANSAITHNGKY